MSRSSPLPLPHPLRVRPFTTAEAAKHGIGESRLRGGDLRRPFHGVRLPVEIDTGFALARGYAPLLRPGDRFSHVTAAQLWGLPLPAPLERASKGQVAVTVRPPRAAPRGRGVTGHRSSFGVATTRHGLACSDAVTVFCELAILLSVEDLVAVGDALVLEPRVLDPRELRPWCSRAELHAAAEAFRGRGCRRARSAAAMVRAGSESRPESLLRLLLASAGFPEPRLNLDIRDPGGRLLGRADLCYPEWRLIVEYDGDQHRSSTRQYERDMTRVEDLVRAGYAVIRVRQHGLFAQPDRTVRRVREALHVAGWRP